jgi:RNA polymerase sigma-70 factor (ECF subfamily)
MPTASHATAPPREPAGGDESPFDPDAALRALYAEHALFLLGYAERFAGDRGSAEDAVQETFLRAWRNLPRILDDDRPVRAWLLRVIRRVLIDAARAAAVRPMSVAEDAVPEPAVDGGFDRVLDSWELTDALGRLSPDHRHALVEVIYRGTPAHLIAARLGVPPSTVRSRVHYARRELSRLLHTPDDPLDPAA